VVSGAGGSATPSHTSQQSAACEKPLLGGAAAVTAVCAGFSAAEHRTPSRAIQQSSASELSSSSFSSSLASVVAGAFATIAESETPSHTVQQSSPSLVDSRLTRLRPGDLSFAELHQLDVEQSHEGAAKRTAWEATEVSTEARRKSATAVKPRG